MKAGNTVRTRTVLGPDYVNLHELNKSRIAVGGLLRVAALDSNLFRIVVCKLLNVTFNVKEELKVICIFICF